MKHEVIVEELEDLAKQIGVAVRYEKGDFEGGYCVLKSEKVLLVNKKLTPQRKASLLARGLQEMGVDNVFIKPVLRQFIEDEALRLDRTTR